ncbi:hypothetical protein M2319_000969 [Rhodobium gokarnense]|uniref:Uncharacterized protein n=1 Tax=Rhodobium gokarnense TaxID=364296 RepID=A0ABT3H8D4_9HYPH|nr:hypothetical protein [Rhodobium gokarnense]
MTLDAQTIAHFVLFAVAMYIMYVAFVKESY